MRIDEAQLAIQPSSRTEFFQARNGADHVALRVDDNDRRLGLGDDLQVLCNQILQRLRLAVTRTGNNPAVFEADALRDFKGNGGVEEVEKRRVAEIDCDHLLRRQGGVYRAHHPLLAVLVGCNTGSGTHVFMKGVLEIGEKANVTKFVFADGADDFVDHLL